MISVFNVKLEKFTALSSAEQAIAGLWRIDEIILNTTNIKDLADKIVNVMLEELDYLKLGYVMIVLSLLDERKKQLKRVSISETTYAKKALQNSSKPFSSIIFNMDNNDNLPVKSLKENQPYITDDLSNMLYPALEREGVKNAQITLGVVSSLVFPIYAQSEPLGTLIFSLNKAEEAITDFERQILVGFTTAVGIALQHAYLYKKLNEVNEELKKLDERKNEFLSVAAHELRAPLTAVKGYLSMVLDGDGGEVTSQIRKFLEGALEGSEREIRLVNNLLNVSRIEEGRLTYQIGNVNLRHVVDTVFEEFRIDAENKGLQFTLHKQENINDVVYVDQDRIHEVIANFISNAIKYTEQGSVKVLLTQTKADTIRFEVSDTGYGITEKEQQNLFQKFYRSESSAGKVLGTGLGLYITKLLIEKFGGSLGIISELGKGSTFWFELPVMKNLETNL